MMKKPRSDAACLLTAVHFAANKHRDQRRKDPGTSPYINHPVEVAHMLATVGDVTDLDVLMAAILHDTIEDTETSSTDLKETFGEPVRELVEEVTDDKSLSKLERKRLQIEYTPTLSDKAKLIKLGDKICNVRDVTHSPPVYWDLDRRREYLDWTVEVIAGCRGSNPALEAHYDKLLREGGEVLRNTDS